MKFSTVTTNLWNGGPLKVLNDSKWVWVTLLVIYDQFAIIQNFQRSPIPNDKEVLQTKVFLIGSNENTDTAPNIVWPYCWAGACDRGWWCVNSITTDYSMGHL